MADDKQRLRTILTQARGALAPDRAQELSAVIASRLIALSLFREARAVVLYSAKDNEVSTGAVFNSAIAARKPVYFPRIDAPRRELVLIRVRARAELNPGVFGILEPAGTERAAAEDLQAALVCVPGVAFTPSGARLGRGGGYYDRLLSMIGPTAVSAGLAYSFQLLDTVPQRPHDRRLDYVITESAVHEAKASAAGGISMEVYSGANHHHHRAAVHHSRRRSRTAGQSGPRPH